MNAHDQEVEVKFYLNDLPAFEARLRALGAKVVQQRVFEANLRFDTPERELTRAHRVLRLRRDERIRLTYKGAAQPGQAVGVRQEIEFEVNDFDAARRLFEALGYQVAVMYEKFRTTYVLGAVEVMLDEMPFGGFTEIEGPGAEEIHAAAERLGLKWHTRCITSYLELFQRVKERRGLRAEHLTFEQLAGVVFTAEDLGLQPADS